MKLLISNIKNSKIFDVNFLNSVCEQINTETNEMKFFPVKITKTKIGLKNALIRSKYKSNGKNTICRVLLFENSKGNLRVSIRKGFMISFLNDLKILQNHVNKLNQ